MLQDVAGYCSSKLQCLPSTTCLPPESHASPHKACKAKATLHEGTECAQRPWHPCNGSLNGSPHAMLNDKTDFAGLDISRCLSRRGCIEGYKPEAAGPAAVVLLHPAPDRHACLHACFQVFSCACADATCLQLRIFPKCSKCWRRMSGRKLDRVTDPASKLVSRRPANHRDMQLRCFKQLALRGLRSMCSATYRINTRRLES